MFVRSALAGLAVACFAGACAADELTYQYEGDVVPYDDSAGWLPGFCEYPCIESVSDGRLVLEWPEPGGRVIYHYFVTAPPETPLASIWIEWRFRSNHPFGGVFDGCDAQFSIDYRGILDAVSMYGDAAISFSGDHVVTGLALDSFHTFRFESWNGMDYLVSVDGVILFEYAENHPDEYDMIQMRGFGGCIGDWIPDARNEWDYVRLGELELGEQIVATEPPRGLLDARVHAALDRFAIVFDRRNFVHTHEIALSVSAPDTVAPEVVAVVRRDDDTPESMQVVLDRPLPMNATTTVTIDDDGTVNTFSFAFLPGDTNGDGRVNLADVATFQNCFGQYDFSGVCQAVDSDGDDDVGITDAAVFLARLASG